MKVIEGKLTFYTSALLYLLFNLRIGTGMVASFKATLWQIAQTAPYIAGVSYAVIVFLQHMAGGDILPWDRKLRIFFAIGIMAGLIYGIYEYTGATGKTP